MNGKRKIIRKTKTKKNRSSNLIARIKYFVLLVFPVIAVVVSIYVAVLRVNAAFHVQKVLFSGNEHLTDEEIRELAGLKNNENMIMLSGSLLYKKLMESPWIRGAAIRKEFPDSIHIHIKEAEPFALLDRKGHLFIIDDRGTLLQELKDSPIPFLPVITGVQFGKNETVSDALSLVHAIREKGLLYEKDHIEIIANKPEEMSINLDGIVVKVGVGNYEDKLYRLVELEEELKSRNIHVDYIDLRFANKAVVKPVNEVIR